MRILTKHIDQDRLFSIACLLCAIPVMVAHYPPMVDLPQHAAQIASLKNILSGNDWPFAALFELNLFTPYWLGYSLVLLLSYPFGIVLAIKLVVAASLCFFPWAAAKFLSRMNVDPGWNWALLILPLGFAYKWGFLNFLVAMPFAFIFLSSVVDFQERHDTRSWLKTVAWVHFLLFSHLLVAGFACIVAAMLLTSPWRGLKQWMQRISPLLAVLPITLLWIWQSLGESQQANDQIVWGVGLDRFLLFLPRMIGAPDTLGLNFAGLLIVALPFILGARISRSPGRWLPFVFFSLFTLFCPQYIMGNLFTAPRFGAFGLPLYLLCFEPRNEANGQISHPHRLAPVTIAIATLMLGWQLVRATTHELLSQGFIDTVAHAVPGKRMLALTIDPWSPSSDAPVFLHYPSWYQAEKSGLTEFNFAKFYGMPLRFKSPSKSSIERGFEWVPNTFDWQRHHGDRYDYFMVRSADDPSTWLIGTSGCTLNLVKQSQGWWLYGRDSSDEPCLR